MSNLKFDFDTIVDRIQIVEDGIRWIKSMEAMN